MDYIEEGHLSVYIGNGNVLVYGGLPFEDEIQHWRVDGLVPDKPRQQDKTQ